MDCSRTTGAGAFKHLEAKGIYIDIYLRKFHFGCGTTFQAVQNRVTNDGELSDDPAERSLMVVHEVWHDSAE